MTEGLRVTRFYMKNILGVTELDFSPGNVTLVEGGNRTGKTSVIKGVERLLNGGHVIHLVREVDGVPVEGGGELGIEIDNGAEGISIKEMVVGDKAKVDVVKDGHPVASPRAWLKTLFDPYSLNPVDFLLEDGKKRQKLLLDAMPITMGPSEITAAVGDPELAKKATAGIEGGSHALTVIEAVRKWIFEDRTTVNRWAKEKRDAARELHKALPPTAAEGTNWDEELSAATLDRDDLIGAMSRASTDAANSRTQADREAKDKYDRAVEAARAVLDKERAEGEAAERVLHQGIRDEFIPKIDKAKERITQISAARDTHVAAEGSRKLLAKTVSEADRLDDESNRRTQAIGNLDSLREKLLEKLPIKGITVAGGDVLWKGRPLESASTTEQIGIVFQVAKLRAGELKLMLIDRFESLDKEQQAAFIASAKKLKDWQFICTVVTGGPLKLEDV